MKRYAMEWFEAQCITIAQERPALAANFLEAKNFGLRIAFVFSFLATALD